MINTKPVLISEVFNEQEVKDNEKKYHCFITGCKNEPKHYKQLTKKLHVLFCEEHHKTECQMSDCNKTAYPFLTLIGMAGEEEIVWFCEEHYKQWNG
ncbi:MAG: hypothetical protein GY853_02080 [PVC group bacterium]|nr:hypothetical protein [PVC group bacterium]